MQFLRYEDISALYEEAAGRPILRYPDGLMQSLAEHQCFVDGNKRIAWLSAKIFLQINGLTTTAPDHEGLDVFVNRIANRYAVEQIAGWLGITSEVSV